MAVPKPNPPSRKSIEQLALRDPVVMHSLQLHAQGRVSYEEALRIAIVAICDQNAVLMARLSQQERERLDRLRLGLPVARREAAAGNVH